jgi:hypothetical protein
MIFAELTPGVADSEFFATIFAFGTLSAASASSPLLYAPRVNLELGQRRFPVRYDNINYRSLILNVATDSQQVYITLVSHYDREIPQSSSVIHCQIPPTHLRCSPIRCRACRTFSLVRLVTIPLDRATVRVT